jgi:hypothetical protein
VPSPRKKRLRENKIEDYLHAEVKALGGGYRRVKWIGRSGANDDLILLPRWSWHALVECKRPGEEPESHQEREHARLRAAGFQVFVVSTFAEIDAMLKPFKDQL